MVSWAALAVVVCGGAGAEQWGARLQDNIGRGEGTYNPKSAWMMVDSRRRVLPDIDVEEHFASVESHILSDIHNYHMGEFQVSSWSRFRSRFRTNFFFAEEKTKR